MNIGQTEQKDLKHILSSYLRYWYLFVLGGAVGIGIGYLYLRYATPKYSISTTMLIKDDKAGGGLPTAGAAAGDFNILSAATKNIDNEMIALKSTSLMERVMSELTLNATYYMPGRVQDIEVYGNYLPIKVIVKELKPGASNTRIVIHAKNSNQFELEDGEKRILYKFGQEIATSYAVFTVVASSSLSVDANSKPVIIKFHDNKSLAAAYAQKLVVAPINAKASVLMLSIIDAVPQKGVDIVSKLIEVYNNEAVEDKNKMAAKTLDFVNDRLKSLTAELSSVEKDVQQYQQQRELADVSSQTQQYLTEASANNRQVSELGIQKDVLESIQNYLTKQNNQYQLVPSSLSIQDPTLVGLITRFNELQMERERMLRTTELSNPVVQSIDEQLANLRGNILENLRNIKNSLAITQRSLQAKSSQFGSRIQQVPVIQRQITEITRQQDVKKALYSFLLQKREESALSLAGAVSNTRIIDPATATGPVSPNGTSVLLNSLLIGLFLPFAGIYLRNALDNKVQGVKDIERVTDTPILGEIARSKRGQTIITPDKSRTPVAEMFRLIRSNLQFATAGKENRVIMITSSMSGEGKTFFSINLGLSLAATGKKVVILGFDLRKPRLLQELGLTSDLGISDYLILPSVSVDDIILPLEIVGNVFVAGSGQIPPNPGELMVGPRVETLLGVLKQNFDYIIIDTAPVGQVADAFAFAPYIDSTIYLTRRNYTLKNQLNIINDIYVNRKLKHPMVILNDTKQEDGYGYYYGEQKKKKFYQFASSKK